MVLKCNSSNERENCICIHSYIEPDTFVKEMSIYLSITFSKNNKIPVMAWIHGESYKNGGCDNISHRLGVLGFLKDCEGSDTIHCECYPKEQKTN
ncbi:hypothetical protein H8356DRAFT_1425402 [Neocallimastix lanati (nom. inval.)]|nr:hypothetical protein H8356DRAFT_1425402 [Neocallimastix sp. JGI-2020a]